MGGSTARAWVDGDEPQDQVLQPELFLPFRLADAADAAARLVSRVCHDRYELTPDEWRSLSALANSRQRQVAPGLLLRGLASGNRADGYVATADGRMLATELSSLGLAYEAALLAALSPEEVKVLHRLLGRVEGAALKLLGR